MSDRSREDDPSEVSRRSAAKADLVGGAGKSGSAEAGAADLPPAVVAAAKREAGATSQAEPNAAVAAMLAQPDPVAAFLKRTRGRLGPEHGLDY